MGGYKLPYCSWKIELLSEACSLGNMAYYDAGTFLTRQLFMRIDTCLILRKERWISHLSNIMVKGSCPYEMRLGSYSIGNFSSKISNHY